MTVTDDPSDTTAPPADEAGSSSILYGQGQAAWLAVVTVMAALALVVSFVALVESSGDGGAEGGGDGGAPAGPVTEATVEASEFVFDPDQVEVVADTDVAVTLDNVGAVDHNWTVLSAGTEIASEAELDQSMVEAVVGDVAAGETVESSVNLAAGSYQVICTIAGHFDAGMEATVTAS